MFLYDRNEVQLVLQTVPNEMLGKPRWEATSYGYSGFGTTPSRALQNLHLLVTWHDAPNGWRTRLASMRFNFHNKFFF